ncbi:SNF2-related protein [Actinokineospora guangxiensis]|uniref:SNF2-related protein n=1 Tax=Actinokineospora guangxiensis TaxID=1490288 RepID=A0ABW0EK18_9PSEU
MLALHCIGTADGRIVLWAEDAARPDRRPGKAGRQAAPHPFAVPGGELAERLGVSGEEVSVRALLPSYPSAPVPSPELVRDPLAGHGQPRGTVKLRPWLVSGLATTATVPEPEDVRLGSGARYLCAVRELAEDLVSRGRVLPAITATGAARWRPAPTGADSARLARLRESMPPAVRADGTPAPAVLTAVLNTLVDAIARERLGELDLAPGGLVPDAAVAVHALLESLTGDPVLGTPSLPTERLAGALDSWRASASHDGPVRACFRLRSPEDERGDDWAVEFLLQAADDPSVLVSARQVWDGAENVLRRWVPQPADLLLAELGRAGRIVPEVDRALRGTHPTGLTVDTAGAHAFLTRAAELDQAGFGVLLPSWWQTEAAQVGLRLTTSQPGQPGVVSGQSAMGRDELVEYRWDMAVGDATLTAAELDALAKAKVPLVRVRGRWVHLDQRRLAAGLEFLRHQAEGSTSVATIMTLAALPADDPLLPAPVVGIDGDGWLADLLNGRVESRLEPVKAPPGFGADLRPYQQRGLAWMAFLDRLGMGACLADDMGLGKTVQLLALEAMARADGPRPPTLLVCPMSLVGNWQREAERFAPDLRVHVHHGADRGRLADAEADIVITTYNLLARDNAKFTEVEWDRVVLDEAQNIKNSASRQSRAARAVPARHRIALTGTPVENRLAELWSIMDFANPGLLGSVHRFRARFAVPIERYGDEDAATRLRRVTGPFVLRRVKTDPTIISDLPDKVEMKQLCNLTAEQASLYQAVVDDMMGKVEESEGVQRKGLVLSTITRLKQVCNHPAQFLGDGSRIAGRSGKLARLEETLEEVLADGDRALVFTQFAAFGGMLVPHLAARFDTEVLFLHGGTPKARRDAMVERFQSGEGPSIFLLSLKAGGTGLTLTAANHVIHLDRWWNPAVEDQATDRAFRIGQRKDVQVRKLMCIGTLEEKVDAMIERKKALAKLAVGAGEDWLTELSTADLREVVSLSAEAVGE